jgi:peptidoglycan/xylan/chitin deacetylase (PgdA/CDA1 family)
LYSGIYDKKGFFVRCLYLLVALAAYCLTLGGRFAGNKWIILCYHGILACQWKRFEWQMKAISGRKSQTIKITFDDAFANLLENAIPVLEHHGIPCDIFAVGGNSGEKPNWTMPNGHPEACEITMTDQQLVLVSKMRLVRIGSHTQTHPDLAKITIQDADRELIESRNNLQRLLGFPVEDLALPHGSYNDKVLNLAQKAGYKRIYTLRPVRVHDSMLSEGVIGRFSMSPDVWKIEFLLTCAGAYSWLDGWRRFLSFVRRCRRSK